MSDLKTFILNKAGLQSEIAKLEPSDDALIISRRNGRLRVFAAGDDTTATTALGLLSWAQHEIYMAEQDIEADESEDA